MKNNEVITVENYAIFPSPHSIYNPKSLGELLLEVVK